MMSGGQWLYVVAAGGVCQAPSDGKKNRELGASVRKRARTNILFEYPCGKRVEAKLPKDYSFLDLQFLKCCRVRTVRTVLLYYLGNRSSRSWQDFADRLPSSALLRIYMTLSRTQ